MGAINILNATLIIQVATNLSRMIPGSLVPEELEFVELMDAK